MGHIDSFRHAQVGFFLGVPVYLAGEDIDGDFHCPSDSLIVGGGSGEHPAAVLMDPVAAVARYIDAELPVLGLKKAVRRQWSDVCRPYLTVPNDGVFVRFGWSDHDHQAFRDRCCSPYAPNSYLIYDGELALDDWLILGMGEFVFFAMPHLAAALMAELDQPYRYFRHVRYNNILLLPPNMPVYAPNGPVFQSILRRIAS